MKKSGSRIFYALGFGLYWMSVCLCMSFAAVFLGAQGLGNTGIGAVLSLANVLSVVLSLLLSGATDRGDRSSSAAIIRRLLSLQVLLLVLSLFPLGVATHALLYVFLAGTVLCLSPLYIKLHIDLSAEGEQAAFSLPRALGSLCFAATSFAAGLLLRRFPPRSIAAFHLVCVAGEWLALSVLKRRLSGGPPAPARSGAAERGYLAFLRAHPRFLLLLGGIFFALAIHNALSTFTVNIVREIGEEDAMVGYLTGVAVLCEIPAMLLYSRVRKAWCRPLLALGMLCFTLRAALIALAGTAWQLYAAFSLQMLAFGLYTPAVVDVVSDEVSYEESGKAQGLAASMSMLGGIFGTLLLGALLDSCPLGFVLWIACGLSAVGSVLAIAGILRRRRPGGEGPRGKAQAKTSE